MICAMKKLGLLVLLVSSIASAEAPHVKTITGTDARILMRAVKLSGIKSTHAKDRWTYKALAIQCHSASAMEDALDSYSCDVDGKALTEAGAFILQGALGAVGVDPDAGMSQTRMKAWALTCVDDQSTNDAAKMFVCSFADGPPK
jgi:hypothetical protein